MLEKLKAAFPDARFVNATELLQDARSVKGAEEVAWIERAAEILDKVVAAILAKAKPGVMENEMVAMIWQTIIANGGDYPSMTHWGAGAGVPGPAVSPLIGRCSRRYDQYRDRSQIWRLYRTDRPGGLLGKIPLELKRAFEASVEVFDELVQFMKPGITFREVVNTYRKLVRESGHTPKGMLLHGRGIGEDRPQKSPGKSTGLSITARLTPGTSIYLWSKAMFLFSNRGDAGRCTGFHPLWRYRGYRKIWRPPLGQTKVFISRDRVNRSISMNTQYKSKLG